MTSHEVVEAIVDGKLPKKFWDLPQFAGKDHLKDLHVMVVDRLQQEAPDADTLELMMMERVCFLYIFMRAEETKDDLTFDRTYGDMMRLWVNMASDLRKQRLRAEELQGLRMSIVTEVSRALKEALKDVDPEVSKVVQSRLITLVA